MFPGNPASKGGQGERGVRGVQVALTRPACGIGSAALIWAPQGGQLNQELGAWGQPGPGEVLSFRRQSLPAFQSQGPQAVKPQLEAIPVPGWGAPGGH